MAFLSFPTFAFVAPAIPTTVTTEVTIEVIQQEAKDAVMDLGPRANIAALAAAAAIGVYGWFRSIQPPAGPISGPADRKEDSKKVLRMYDALKLIESEFDDLTGIGFWIPGPLSIPIKKRFLARMRKLALGQTGHTERLRVSRGKRGRPKTTDPGDFKLKYLRPPA